MKFIIQPQNGLRESVHTVWDAVDEKPLCTFVNGAFETEDATVIKKLMTLGYESELIEGEPEPITFSNELKTENDAHDESDYEAQAKFDEEAIRAHAKELGIKSWHIKSIDKLKEEIAER